MLKFLRVALFLSVLSVVIAPIVNIPAVAQTNDKRAELIQYSETTNLNAVAAEGKTVVFFFATWCPNCILTLTELSEKWSDLNPDLTIVIADYDTETELKAKYGVTYQDTFVLLDKNGDAVKRWNAGGIAGVNENTK